MNKKTVTVGFKTTPEIKEALDYIATKEDRTISYIVNRIIKEHLESINASNKIEAPKQNGGST